MSPSSCSTSPFCPAAAIVRPTSASLSLEPRVAVSTTCARAAANPSAIARPIPREAPVTRITLSCRSTIRSSYCVPRRPLMVLPGDEDAFQDIEKDRGGEAQERAHEQPDVHPLHLER